MYVAVSDVDQPRHMRMHRTVVLGTCWNQDGFIHFRDKIGTVKKYPLHFLKRHVVTYYG